MMPKTVKGRVKKILTAYGNKYSEHHEYHVIDVYVENGQALLPPTIYDLFSEGWSLRCVTHTKLETIITFHRTKEVIED